MIDLQKVELESVDPQSQKNLEVEKRVHQILNQVLEKNLNLQQRENIEEGAEIRRSQRDLLQRKAKRRRKRRRRRVPHQEDRQLTLTMETKMIMISSIELTRQITSLGILIQNKEDSIDFSFLMKFLNTLQSHSNKVKELIFI